MRNLFFILIGFVTISAYGQYRFKPFTPPVSYEEADKRAEIVLKKLSVEEKIDLINGYNVFYIKGYEKYNMPQICFTDATQGVRVMKDKKDPSKSLHKSIESSTAFPCALNLSATWNPELAAKYAQSIGEECRSGDIGVLLGPGMNIYRISQCGRNFEYFGEDPFLAARMIENYVVGVQSTGTIATLKHFCLNNTEYNRLSSNSIVDERTMNEIYFPAFKAGIDAGAMAVMTSYNQINGEWAGQSNYVINKLLRKDLGFKWLVMTDWGSVWDCEKIIKSGQDLEMPGNDYIHKDALNLFKAGKVKEADIDRMAKSIIRTCIAMGLYDRPVKDVKYLDNYPEHSKIALQTAREGIVLLRNQNNILPVTKEKTKKILLTGEFIGVLPKGGGSGEVQGYDNVTMLAALTKEFGDKIEYVKEPTDEQLKAAGLVFLSVGTKDSEGRDRPFVLSEEKEKTIMNIAAKNKNVVVIINSGSGIQMTNWYDKVKAIIYAWYPGQAGYTALAEILSGKTNPSGKLPITIEKKFEDSPGYGYIPIGEDLDKKYVRRKAPKDQVYDIRYNEGVFVGYRWYESKKIAPLYPFGFGLSYTTFKYDKLTLPAEFKKGETVKVEFTLKNTGKTAGFETAQLYIQDVHSSVPRPVKELKAFSKVYLEPGQTKTVIMELKDKDFAFWDEKIKNWNTETGDFNILIGSASDNIKLKAKISLVE
ncbi:MAG: glycoside hydrolase family 3 C-terminal domain-containing protein [Bacteroidales bacterium]|nr:glycoside hydrolase family 3 C-terminal domain-containing protein [Bacteroidales bacterium]